MDPHPASSQPALPLCSLSAPRLHYRWVFIPHVMFHQRPPSRGLRVSKSGGIERHRCALLPETGGSCADTRCLSTRVLFGCSLLPPALWLVLAGIASCTCEIFQAVFPPPWMQAQSLQSDLTVSPGVSDCASSTLTLFYGFTEACIFIPFFCL